MRSPLVVEKENHRTTMNLKFQSDVFNDYTEEVKDIYVAIEREVMECSSLGGRYLSVWFMGDDVDFSHLKPVVDKLSKTGLFKVTAEGGSVLKPHIRVEW